MRTLVSSVIGDCEDRALVGGANHPGSYEQWVHRLAAEDRRVVLAGFRWDSDLHELYSHAGAFVLPSYHEGLSLALLDALGCKLPIVCTNINANMAVLQSAGGVSRTFVPGDVGALRDHIRELVDCRAVGQPHRPMDPADMHSYDWDTIAEQTMAIYETVLRSPR